MSTHEPAGGATNGRANGDGGNHHALTGGNLPPGIDTDEFRLVREGARRDEVEILVYESRFPEPGTKAEKRAERSIALMFLLAGLFATAFVVIYLGWPVWFPQPGGGVAQTFYTPLLGTSLGLSLLFIGLATVTWGKKLLPREEGVQQRHLGASPEAERASTGATIRNMGRELGLKRRPVLKFGLLGLVPVGLAAVVPLGALINKPNKNNQLVHTGWNPANNKGQPVPVTHEDGSPVFPEDVSVGGQITVFPGIPAGATNKWADSPTLLIHLRNADADTLRGKLLPVNKNAMWNDFVAYSKICTHLGCPASLYEQKTNVLLCPCHQSQFKITDNATPIFGPATNRLPMLPISVDPQKGYLVATGDFREPIGPGFWERP